MDCGGGYGLVCGQSTRAKLCGHTQTMRGGACPGRSLCRRVVDLIGSDLMPASFATPPSSREQLSSDEHREWVRVEDHLLLEYRLVTDRADVPPPGLPPVTQEMVAAAV